MRRAVAIDTSTAWGGVALVELDSPRVAPELVGELGLGNQRSHAGTLLDRIEAVLVLAGWRRSDVDLFVACRGPGSFTGLRIGLGTIRGLAVAAGRPAVGVETLRAMAEAFGPAEADRVALLDAGRGEVYAAAYDPAGSPPVERCPPAVLAPEGLGELLESGRSAGSGRSAVCFGPGVARVGAAGVRLPQGIRLANGPRGVAAAAARLALIHPPDDPESTLAPIYVRPPDATIGGRR